MQRLSDKTLQLLIDYEVGGGRSYYEKFLKTPSWPGGDSGCTVGIGYDCGYYDARTIAGDWGEAGLEDHDTSLLTTAAGLKGPAARDRAKVLQCVTIPWQIALWVFEERTIPKYIRMTLRAFPGSELKLNADGFGALVSLVFNRGPSMDGARRVEMRAIRDLIDGQANGPALQYKIAQQIRAMIPLWRGHDIYNGMRNRRNAEADLMDGQVTTPKIETA